MFLHRVCSRRPRLLRFIWCNRRKKKKKRRKAPKSVDHQTYTPCAGSSTWPSPPRTRRGAIWSTRSARTGCPPHGLFFIRVERSRIARGDLCRRKEVGCSTKKQGRTWDTGRGREWDQVQRVTLSKRNFPLRWPGERRLQHARATRNRNHASVCGHTGNGREDARKRPKRKKLLGSVQSLDRSSRLASLSLAPVWRSKGTSGVIRWNLCRDPTSTRGNRPTTHLTGGCRALLGEAPRVRGRAD